MLAMLLAIEVSIGVGVGLNVNDGFNTEQENPLGVIKISQPITKNISIDYLHASELSDGINSTIRDRDYINLMYKF